MPEIPADQSSLPGPSISPDVQEALSKKYSDEMVLVLPLKSGNLALFSRDFTLQEIVDGGEQLHFQRIQDLSREFYAKMFNKSKFAAEARFYGEPGDKDLARDLKRQRKPERTKNIHDLSDALIFES